MKYFDFDLLQKIKNDESKLNILCINTIVIVIHEKEKTSLQENEYFFFFYALKINYTEKRKQKKKNHNRFIHIVYPCFTINVLFILPVFHM